MKKTRRDVLEKLEKDVKGSVKVPGNYPYKDGMSTGVSPVSLENCNSCGTCEKVCPTEAVHVENGKVVNAPEKCILCMACVYACPRQAAASPGKYESETGRFEICSPRE